MAQKVYSKALVVGKLVPKAELGRVGLGDGEKNLFVNGPEFKRKAVIKPRLHFSVSRHRLHL